MLYKRNIDEAIKNLEAIKKTFPIIKKRFIQESLEEILNFAIENLIIMQTYTRGNFGIDLTNKTNWKITILEDKGILECLKEEGTYLEFGIGIKGSLHPHPNNNDYNYQYDINNHGNGGWHFKDQNDDWWFKFAGYTSRPFLFDAMNEYIDKQRFYIIYQTILDEEFRKVIK